MNIKYTDEEIYWQMQSIVDYGRLYNFIVGNRGAGKTFGAKEFVIKDYLKNGNQFIYLMRHGVDVDNLKGKFFTDINIKFDKKFTQETNELIWEREDCENVNQKGEPAIIKEVMGWSLALSTHGKKKSVPYPNVKWIIFDEFIIEDNQRYLKNEVNTFLNFYVTVARPGTNHIPVYCYFLTNATNIYNPYFDYFGINIQKYNGITKYKDFIIQHLMNSKLIERQQNTAFGRIIKDSEYEQYAFFNNFVNDNTNLVQKLTNKHRCMLKLVLNKEEYGLWISPDYDYVLSSKGQSKIKFAVDAQSALNSSLIFLTKQNHPRIIKNIVNQYKTGKLFYETQEIREKWKRTIQHLAGVI